MKQDELLARHHEVLKRLSWLPRKMIAVHGQDNVTEFVLHELCDAQCFNLDRAAFIVDNADFNCLKGVTGISRSEAMKEPNIWQASDRFSAHMQKSAFNQKVRGINRSSLKKDVSAQKDVIAMLAYDLGFKNHNFCSWDLKHANQGYLVFEKVDNDDVVNDEHLLNGLSLLSHCPIF